MKILNNPNPVVKEIKVCPKCFCEFEYFEGDIHHYSNGIMGPGFKSYSWINCPNCGERIIK